MTTIVTIRRESDLTHTHTTYFIEGVPISSAVTLNSYSSLCSRSRLVATVTAPDEASMENGPFYQTERHCLLI